MSFSEEVFPTDISFGSLFGPEFSTEVVALDSGFESRNARWTQARARGNVAYGIKTPAQLQTLLTFFRARRGRFQGFRFKFWQDYTATGEAFGVGDGATTAFQLTKTYTSGSDSFVKDVKKPVSGAETIYVAGSPQATPGDYTLDAETGIVTFAAAPSGGQALTWDGEFHHAVRFDVDHLPVAWEQFERGDIESIPIVEVRL